MDLFKRKRKELPPLFSAGDLDIMPEVANYNSAVEFLIGLSDEEYAKVIKATEIYRKSQVDVAKALGVENEPTTFIHQPERDDMQTIEPAFLDHEPKKPKSKKANSKNDKGN